MSIPGWVRQSPESFDNLVAVTLPCLAPCSRLQPVLVPSSLGPSDEPEESL